MLFPSKILSLDESLLAKLPLVATWIKASSNLNEAYSYLEDELSVDEFINCVDMLYIIEFLDVKEGGEVCL